MTVLTGTVEDMSVYADPGSVTVADRCLSPDQAELLAAALTAAAREARALVRLEAPESEESDGRSVGR